MRSSLSAISVLAILFLVVAMPTVVRTPVAEAQDKPVAAKIALTTVPSPAHKGGNTVRVRLTDPASKPISGADVSITFFMAAMPAMNMPEMKTVIKAVDKGAGIYEGKGDLGSGGIWDVTISASKAGKPIATEKLSVKATGGS